MVHRLISRKLMAGAGGLSAVALVAALSLVLIFPGGSGASPQVLGASSGVLATAPGLGNVATYAVLGGQSVTNTGPTTIDGDLGVSPGTSVTNFPPGIVTGGTVHSADTSAQQAQDATLTAYNALSAQGCTANLTGQDLGGLTLVPGVYCFDSSAQLTGMLMLDAQGDAAAVFIFKTVSTLTTATGSSVLVINGGIDCNVFWRIGSSAPIGVGTTFVGNILAQTTITLATGASVSGRVLAQTGSVTLDDNHVGFEACAVATATPSPTASPTATAAPTGAPTPTPVGQTPAPTPIPTPVPTDTPVGQTPAPTPAPTPTPVGQTPSPTPIPTPTPSATPTPSPTPVGQTPSPTPSPTPVVQTPSPTPSPTPVGQTPSPTPTPTPTPVAPTPSPTHVTATPSPTTASPSATPTLPPPPAPTNTPSMTPAGPPNAGGPPPQGSLPLSPLVLGIALVGFAAAAFVLGRHGRPATQRADR